DAERGRRDAAQPLDLAPDRVDLREHLAEVAGDRQLLDREGDAPVLDPEPGRAAREVARHGVEAVAEEPGAEQAPLGARDHLLERGCAGLEPEVAGAGAGRTTRAAGRARRGGEAELARGVAVEQPALQHAALDDDGAARRQPLAVEGPAREPARPAR